MKELAEWDIQPELVLFEPFCDNCGQPVELKAMKQLGYSFWVHSYAWDYEKCGGVAVVNGQKVYG